MTLGFCGGLLGILQVIGAILAGLLFRFATEKVSLEFADFAAQKLPFLVHFFEALAGTSMHALPIAGLLPQFEILPPQAVNRQTQSVVLGQQPCRQNRRIADGFDR
jgi:hypothetical protein